MTAVAACTHTLNYSALGTTEKITLNSEMAAQCSSSSAEKLQICFFKAAKEKGLSPADSNQAWELLTSMRHQIPAGTGGDACGLGTNIKCSGSSGATNIEQSFPPMPTPVR